MKNRQLPLDWKVVDLEDVGYIKARIGWRGLSKSEYTEHGPYLVAGKHVKSGKVLWETADHITKDRYDESIEIALIKGDVIFSKDGTLGNPAFVDYLPGKATINGTMMLVRSKNTNILLPKFLYFNINSRQFDKLIYEKVSGSSVPHLFQRDMKKYKITLPPLEEQKKIANILSTWDRAIEQQKALIDYLKLRKHSIVNLLIKGNVNLSNDNGIWTKKTIGEIIDEVNEKSISQNQYPLITSSRKGIFLQEDYFKKSVASKNNIGYKIISRDEITYRAMSDDGNFKFNRLDIVDKGIVSPAYSVFKPKGVNGTYLLELINSEKFSEQIRRVIQGGTRLSLKLNTLKKFTVSLPSKEIQDRIAEIIHKFDQEILLNDQKLERYMKQKQGLMQQLLTGKIRVQP